MTIYNCVFRTGFFDFSLINSRNFYDITQHYLMQRLVTDKFEYYWIINLRGKFKSRADELYLNMYNEYLCREDGFSEIIRAYLIELLITVFRALRKKARDGMGESLQDILQHVVCYIECNFNRSITIEELSMLSFQSPSSLCRNFRKHIGSTIKEFIQKTRIEEACRLLKNTDRKVSDIALDTGYHDLKYFNTVFKHKMGVTPSQFRRQD